MSLLRYIKDKIIFIFLQAVVIGFIAIVLRVFDIPFAVVTLVILSILIINFIWLTYDYLLRHQYYKQLLSTLSQMDKKHLVSRLLETPSFADGEVFHEVIKETTKSMNDEIASYQISNEEYHNYIETWIHEIKTPLACMDLICKNSPCELTEKIANETSKVDFYIEQVLFYARSTNVVADYRIKKLWLLDLVKTTVKKHSKQLIAAGCHLSFDIGDIFVYADEKWLDFIIGQVIANAIKYCKDNFSLSFSAIKQKENIILSIKDNGIGIKKTDIPRVFEKGFTGENGRAFAKSTGIGLYICKTLCDKMYLGFEINSKENIETEIRIIFPKDRQSFIG